MYQCNQCTNNIEIKSTAVILRILLKSLPFKLAPGWICVQPSPHDYVTTNYDGKRCFGLVKTVFNEEE